MDAKILQIVIDRLSKVCKCLVDYAQREKTWVYPNCMSKIVKAEQWGQTAEEGVCCPNTRYTENYVWQLGKGMDYNKSPFYLS